MVDFVHLQLLVKLLAYLCWLIDRSQLYLIELAYRSLPIILCARLLKALATHWQHRLFLSWVVSINTNTFNCHNTKAYIWRQPVTTELWQISSSNRHIYLNRQWRWLPLVRRTSIKKKSTGCTFPASQCWPTALFCRWHQQAALFFHQPRGLMVDAVDIQNCCTFHHALFYFVNLSLTFLFQNIF